jgi:RNA polymerase sigma-70 factor (ECF subfamily)
MGDPKIAGEDAALVERARRGSACAFEALVRHHYRAAYAVALAVTGNAMDAEDVCQDAFLRALDRLDDCRQPDRFAAWLLRIVRNGGHNFREYRRLRAGDPLEMSDPPAPADSARDAARAELRGRLEAAVAELPLVQREVVLLHDLDGWKHQDIAEALGISEGRSRQHLFHARRKLRALLGEGMVKEYLHEG